MKFKEFAAKNGILWLTSKQAAKLMQCSREHVYDLAKSGRVPQAAEGGNRLPRQPSEGLLPATGGE